MSLWKIAWRSIQQRSLASALTAVSMALGVSLVVAVLVIHSIVYQSFHRGGEGYDLVVGAAKGSRLELVLASVYYIGQPADNLPYSYYKNLREGELSEYVELAIPICLGDNYEDYRVVGTVPEMFEKLRYLGDQSYKFAEGGRNFEPENFFESVIGATVAKKTGLKVGDTFRPTHDVAGQTKHKHRPFTVVGILEPTGTPNDRALFVNIEGFYRVGQHAARLPASDSGSPLPPGEGQGVRAVGTGKDSAKPEDHHATDHSQPLATAPSPRPSPEGRGGPAGPAEHADADDDDDHDHDEHAVIPDEAKRVTSVLVCTDQAKLGSTRTLARMINQGNVALAAVPADEINRLFETIIGKIELVLLIFAVMIVIVAGIGIMVSIYNSMSDRRHEIAIMRALGASRQIIMLVILLESILLSLGGGALGLALAHGAIAAGGPLIAEWTPVNVGLLQFRTMELILIPGLLVLASVVGYLPAVAAYKTDVAKSLSDNA